MRRASKVKSEIKPPTMFVKSRSVTYDEIEDLDKAEEKGLITKSDYLDEAAAEQVPFVDTGSSDKIKKRKRKCYKNLVIMSLSFLFAFTSVSSLSNLQTTLNKEGNIGINSLVITSISFLFSCLFLPAITIRIFGQKWAIFVCQILYSLFVFANFYPRWWTLYPAGFLGGIASGPLWTIQGCMISDLANEYAYLSKEPVEAVISRFFGIFMIIFQFQQVIGNLLTSVILKKSTDIEWFNVTINEAVKETAHCGAYDCPAITNVTQVAEGEASIPPDPHSVFTMCIILASISVSGIIMVGIFLDNMKHKAPFKSALLSLFEAVALFADWRALLMLPIQAMCCFISVYIGTDVTKSFIACMRGIEYVGFWFVFFGIAASASAFCVGHSVKYLGRVPFFLAAFSTIIGIHTFMLYWRPKPDQFYIVFLFPIFYGMCEGVWSTQINSIIATIFRSQETAAFANNRLTSSLMFVSGFAFTVYFCIHQKLYIIIASAIISVISYIILEIKLKASEFHDSKITI